MSINTYDEQKFWEEVDILFPDIVKAITSLAKKSYISITNLRNGVTWWSEKAMEYFGMQENYTIRGQEKSKRSLHPDDLEDFRRGFQERVAGKNMDEPWEYRVRDGSTYNRISARAKMLNDKDGKPFVILRISTTSLAVRYSGLLPKNMRISKAVCGSFNCWHF